MANGLEANGTMVLVPVGRYIPGKFVQSFSLVCAAIEARMPLATSVSDALPLEKAREALLREALLMHPKVSYALWLDSDMLAEPSHINAMLDYAQAHPEADVVSALYFNRLSLKPVAYRQLEPNGKIGTPLAEIEPEGNAPAGVDAAGMGCMLVRLRSIKEKVLPLMEKEGRRKFFWFEPDGHSEDVNFCLLMRRAGLRIMLLQDVVVPHYGASVTRLEYEQGKKKGEQD
ncbi:Uncharacterised protein [Candidatus Anstonella stagnisolia]|nr:Uncharacterised protein [Candidatus Anstonella stagnisolia]